MNSELLKVKDSLILISAGGSSGKIFKSLNNLEVQPLKCLRSGLFPK